MKHRLLHVAVASAGCLVLLPGCDPTPAGDAAAGQPAGGEVAQAAGVSGPRVLVSEPLAFDLQEVYPGEVIFRTLRLKNGGDAPLVLGEPAANCSCLSVSLEPRTLQPGEEARLAYEYRAKMTPGPDALRIAVPTNDPGYPALVLEGRAVIVPEVLIEPPGISVAMAPGTRREVSATFRARRGAFGVLGVTRKGGADGGAGVWASVSAGLERLGPGYVRVTQTLELPPDARGVYETAFGVSERVYHNPPDPENPGAPDEFRIIQVPVTITVIDGAPSDPAGSAARD